MTIKRRLFLSNILMITLPLVLSVSAGLCIFFLMFFNLGQFRESEADRRVSEEAGGILRSWPDNASLTDIIKDIEDFNVRYRNRYLSLSLYKGSDPILRNHGFPDSGESILNNTISVMDHSGKYQLVVTTIKNKTKKYIGEYRVVLTKTEIHTYALRMGLESLYFAVGLCVLVFIGFVTAIVFLTNRFLVHFVFDNINMSIDALKYGVGQIRDGNLSCRLNTDRENEFDEVSADFNEMAGRLLDSVNSHLMDETGRQELIAGISHDLRTPLTSVRAYVEGIENGLDSSPEIRARYIQTIKNRLHDLEQVTDTLLLFSSLDLNEFPWYIEKTNLSGELELIISGLRDEYMPRGLSVSFLNENSGELWANIDSQQMRNVMINILENSVKYKTKKQGKMEIRLYRDNLSAIIAMTDDGPGVPDESLGRLFDIFYRVDSSRSEAIKGNGLGLAMAAKIVRSFNGMIRAENLQAEDNSEGGLSIIIKLPLIEGKE